LQSAIPKSDRLLESCKQPSWLRLSQTKNALRLIQRRFACGDRTRPDSQGRQMIEDRLHLQGCSQDRRVVLVLKRIKAGLARQSRRADGRRLGLPRYTPDGTAPGASGCVALPGSQ
jgi:hypothetical protein